MIKVGINGFGRIGRAIFRINSKYNLFDITEINDINPDINNIAYTLQYDSSYGKFNKEIKVKSDGLKVDNKTIKVHNQKDISNVDWDVDILIDSSGIPANASKARKLKAEHVLITHTPDKKFIDSTYVFGADSSPPIGKVISTSICDTVAFAPVAKALDNTYGIEHVFITTLHPWLSYQNLLDGSAPNLSYGDDISSFVLGRASPQSLIAKPTTVGDATLYVMPELKDKISCYSFRVPTAHVTASDLTFELKTRTTKDMINDLFYNLSLHFPGVYGYNTEPLVSVDFLGNEQSVVVDGRWTSVLNEQYLKLVIWYDNEWGYSKKVVDLVRLIESNRGRA
jgi:glyceraldehyde 3-phosphate dehydrogenase